MRYLTILIFAVFCGAGFLCVACYSEHGERRRAELLVAEKNGLHESVREFERAVLLFETAKCRIRIDALDEVTYRYAAWSRGAPMSEKPDLILHDGEWIPEGSLGNGAYKFTNGNYVYECYYGVTGPVGGTYPCAVLTVCKNGEKILSQDAEKLWY